MRPVSKILWAVLSLLLDLRAICNFSHSVAMSSADCSRCRPSTSLVWQYVTLFGICHKGTSRFLQGPTFLTGWTMALALRRQLRLSDKITGQVRWVTSGWTCSLYRNLLPISFKFLLSATSRGCVTPIQSKLNCDRKLKNCFGPMLLSFVQVLWNFIGQEEAQAAHEKTVPLILKLFLPI